MTQRLVVLLAGLGVVAAGCGDGGAPLGGAPAARPRAAKAAIKVDPNDVSCSTPARTLFAAGLCVCEDLQLVGSGVTALSSDGHTVNVGVNGLTHVVGDYDLAGTLSSWKGVDDVGTLNVRDDLVTPAGVTGVGDLKVGRDLTVGGELSTVGQLTVGGLLRAAGTVKHVGAGTRLPTGPYVAPAAPPCGCEKSQLFDVKAAVDEAKARNDNARIDARTVRSVGELTVDLDGGRYYLDSLSSVGNLRLKVHAPSAVFVFGDLKTVGTDFIDVDEGASLDLYVSGDVENVGQWKVGTGTAAGVVRLFVGGDGPLVTSVGDADFVGSIYAPTARVELVGDTSIRGALFAKSVSGVGRLLIDYCTAAVPVEGACPR